MYCHILRVLVCLTFAFNLSAQDVSYAYKVLAAEGCAVNYCVSKQDTSFYIMITKVFCMLINVLWGYLLLLRILIPVIHQMQHDVVWEGAVPCFGAALGVHGVLGVAELMQQVEGFDAGDELALEEGLADGGVQHEVVGVQFAAAIAATGVHVAVG